MKWHDCGVATGRHELVKYLRRVCGLTCRERAGRQRGRATASEKLGLAIACR